MTEIAEEPRVTWTPDPARAWRPLPDSKTTHGPGAQFNPDGTGGGDVAWTEERWIFRPGFRRRSRVEQRIVIRKEAHGG
jgi:hypothetical protein